MTEKERQTRLMQWFEVIHHDVEDLVIDNHIFWELQATVNNSPRFLQCSRRFTQWMASSFVQATAVGVRRQAKNNDDSVSLKRFLLEIQKYPSLVSREHYMSYFTDKEEWLVELGHRDFDHYAGKGQPHIPAQMAEQHLNELAAAALPIEHYVDRRIAHYDKRGLAQPVPLFDDLSAALKTLQRLVIHYQLLLQGSANGTLTHFPR